MNIWVIKIKFGWKFGKVNIKVCSSSFFCVFSVYRKEIDLENIRKGFTVEIIVVGEVNYRGKVRR